MTQSNLEQPFYHAQFSVVLKQQVKKK